ncbi:MAG TPA: GNAT family N-acetyltransferase [Actinophytocola sp.]|uniref:GNAT family N-acetyltransferase n=1 Tax=Actinophytocola sp. TaxID=1872138 RepID=UPI002DB9BC98|nr:GNAT family N-acetyltransferase [Actinophytocola sp.]HEU5475023.1 GNAT family N-acetyltransferase [Actinophytocola sp.]
MNQTQVGIRRPTEADTAAVHAFLAGLSTSTQYQRFFTGLGSVSPSLVRELIAVRPRQHVVLAVRGAEVVGHAMAATNSAGAVELGVVVAEEYRNRGLASRLIRTLVEQAAAAGADRLQLDVLCENDLVLDWIRRRLPDTVFERDGNTLTGYAPLHPAMVAASPAA